MAVTQSRPNRNKRRATLIVLLAGYAIPAFAASPNAIRCDETGKANLELPIRALMVKAVNHDISMNTLDEIAAASEKTEFPTADLPAPAVTDIRKAFGREEEHPAEDPATVYPRRSLMIPVVGTDAGADPDDANELEDGDTPSMDTRLPGVSEDELSRFKKQMYRRDI